MWLNSPTRLNVSTDLQLRPGYQPHKAASVHDSVFHGAIADTVPDVWEALRHRPRPCQTPQE